MLGGAHDFSGSEFLGNPFDYCVTPMRRTICCRIPPPISPIDYHMIPQHHLPFLNTNVDEKTDTLDEMNPIAGQKSVISITSNCGNVTDSYKNLWNNCDISVADEKRAVLEWLSPLEPRERHQAIGMDRVDGVGDWLLVTSEFVRWSEGCGGTASPVLLCYGDPGVGKTYLRYG